MSVTGLLNERAATHGRFEDNARVGQHLRDYWRQQPAWASMPDVQREALDHIAGKLSRILSGQATYADHFADISGYAELARAACPQPAPPLVSLPAGLMDATGQWHNRCDS